MMSEEEKIDEMALEDAMKQYELYLARLFNKTEEEDIELAQVIRKVEKDLKEQIKKIKNGDTRRLFFFWIGMRSALNIVFIKINDLLSEYMKSEMRVDVLKAIAVLSRLLGDVTDLLADVKHEISSLVVEGDDGEKQ